MTRPREATLGGLAHGSAGRLPMVEAVPAELIGGANLIGEAKGIDPALLFGAPAAVPGKLDDARLSAALDRDCSNEVRAARPRVNAQAIDGPFGMRVQQLVDEPDDLDPRDVADERDGRRLGARGKGSDVSLEAFRRARAREDLGINRHGRNISGTTSVSKPTATAIQTNLTVQSTRDGSSEKRQW